MFIRNFFAYPDPDLHFLKWIRILQNNTDPDTKHWSVQEIVLTRVVEMTGVGGSRTAWSLGKLSRDAEQGCIKFSIHRRGWGLGWYLKHKMKKRGIESSYKKQEVKSSICWQLLSFLLAWEVLESTWCFVRIDIKNIRWQPRWMPRSGFYIWPTDQLEDEDHTTNKWPWPNRVR